MSSSSIPNTFVTSGFMESLHGSGLTIKDGKDSIHSNRLRGPLFLRREVSSAVLDAVYAVLQGSIGNSPTITVNDIYSQLLGPRGTRAWENEQARKKLSSQTIGKILTREGFVNVMPSGRIARYRVPQHILDDIRKPYMPCIHAETCSNEPGSTDAGICGSFETEVTT